MKLKFKPTSEVAENKNGTVRIVISMSDYNGLWEWIVVVLGRSTRGGADTREKAKRAARQECAAMTAHFKKSAL